MSTDAARRLDGMSRPEVVFFDVNETLSDLSSMGACFERVGAPAHLAGHWFAALLRDGFALAATDQMVPFAEIGSQVLRALFVGLPLNRSVDAAVEEVMAGFSNLTVHPDVVRGVAALRELDLQLVTLSNGSASVAEGLLGRAGVLPHFTQVLSAQDAGVWKPSVRAYVYGLATCDVEAARAMLVAVHPWDIEGANRAGLQTVWLNRWAALYPSYLSSPTMEIASLPELADRLR